MKTMQKQKLDIVSRFFEIHLSSHPILGAGAWDPATGWGDGEAGRSTGWSL